MTLSKRVAPVVLAGILALGVTSCSGGGGDATPTSSPSPSGKSTPDPVLQGIEVKDAKIVITGDKVGDLKATITNTTKEAVTLRAVACTCAGMVQLGTSTDGGATLQPLSTGVPIEAGASGEVGTTALVRLSGLTDSTVEGATVTLTGYFGTAGVADFSATVTK